MVPRQIIEEQHAEIVNKAGETVSDYSVSILGGNFFVNSLLMRSLNQLWVAVNGLQLTTHLPLFQTKFPANAGLFVRQVIEVSTFDVMPDEVLASVTNFPERGSHGLAFESSGYENIFLA